MEAKKLAITLAEYCARYAKACGKSGILQTKPLPKCCFEGLKYSPIETTQTPVIPKFLYHLTDKTHYEHMLEDGRILMSQDKIGNTPICPGIFMVDILNFFRNWNKHSNWSGNLKRLLVCHATQRDANLVMLRIPTESIDTSKLVVRAQESFFENRNELKLALNELNVSDPLLLPAEFKRKFSFYFDGISPKNISAAEMNEKSMEYIYKDIIPMSKVEKIGEFDTHRDLPINEHSPMHFIFSNLLKGQAESNLTELLA